MFYLSAAIVLSVFIYYSYKIQKNNYKIELDELKNDYDLLKEKYNNLQKEYNRWTDRDEKGRFVKNEQ